MVYYLTQIAPESDWRTAKQLLWKSLDPLGKEGSQEKEEAIRRLILQG
jgi:hypothetical protein